MLVRSGRGMPVDLADWAIEPKWDGWRCLARVDRGALRLTSRWRKNLTLQFPELSALPAALLERHLLLDGEIVALRADGSQDFHALMERRSSPRTRIAFVCFDALHIDGEDITGLAYVERRHQLEQLHLKHRHWMTSPSARHEAATALYGFTLFHRWEGVVAKRLDSATGLRHAVAHGSR
jgi:bifunctional non-homologous end joining protein LigD